MRTVWLFTVFVLLVGSYSAFCKCNKSTAAQLEEELRKLFEIALHNQTLYDAGDILKWNCTDETGKNSSQLDDNASSSGDEPAETVAGIVTVEESTKGEAASGSSLSKRISSLNTYTLVYKNIFDSRKDENIAPSSNVPIKVTANISSGNDQELPALDIGVQNGPKFSKATKGTSSPENANTQVDSPATDHNIPQTESPLVQWANDSSEYNPVILLLGEKHGITFLNATHPGSSILLNYTNVNAYGIDYQFRTRTIFFTGKGKIRSTGSPAVVVAAGAEGAVRLAVDWLHDRLYWLSDNQQTVEAADLDGQNRSLLVDNLSGIRFPNNIAIDPYDGLIFFVANFTIYRTDLDRKKLEIIEPQDNVTKTVRCIALDLPSKRLVFSGKISDVLNKQKTFIASSNYDGGDVKYFDIGNADWNELNSMDVYRDLLYFTHYDAKESDTVWMFNTSWTGKRPVKVYDAPGTRGRIWSIKAYHSEVQKQSDKVGE